MTLIELLVVIIILTTIVAAAIPIMAPADENRRLREATRGLNAYISGAQTRAIALNRPVGVAFKRLAQDTLRPDDRGVCLEVFYVEQAPPYAGFDEANSRACVALYPNQPGNVLIRFITRGPTDAGLPRGWMADLFPSGMIRPGDLIEISGTRFQLLDPEGYEKYSNIDIVDIGPLKYFDIDPREGVAIIPAWPINDSGQQIKPVHESRLGRDLNDGPLDPSPQRPYWTAPAPYKILRQPTITSDEPYQLPEGAAIDLRASGVGSDNYFYVPEIYDNNDRIMIMFAPEGSISSLWFNRKFGDDAVSDVIFDGPVAENVYLLIGQRAKIPAPAIIDDSTLDAAKWGLATNDQQRQVLRRPLNWLSNDSRWVVIGAQSGRVATIKNGFVEIATITASGAPSELMRTDQIRTAREFTRDMVQDEGR